MREGVPPRANYVSAIIKVGGGGGGGGECQVKLKLPCF